MPCVPTKTFQRCAGRERQGKLALPCAHGQPCTEKAAMAIAMAAMVPVVTVTAVNPDN